MSGFPADVVELVYVRSSYLCEVAVVCNSWVHTGPLHHRQARGMGGTSNPNVNAVTNSLAACLACHAWVEAHPEQSRVAGWMVPFGKDPALVPVLYRGGGRVLLTADGGVTPYVPDDPAADEFDREWARAKDERDRP